MNNKSYKVTLASLVINLCIGSFIVVLLIKGFYTAKSNYNQIYSLTEIEDNLYFAIFNLTETLSHAKNIAITNKDDIKAIITFTLQGENDGSIKDCNGMKIEANVIKENIYAAENGSLYCNKTVPIIKNTLSALSIRYGIGKAPNIIEQYVSSEYIPLDAKIYSLKVAMLVHSTNNVYNEDIEQEFKIFDQVITIKDKRLHKLHVFTIPLLDI